ILALFSLLRFLAFSRLTHPPTAVIHPLSLHDALPISWIAAVLQTGVNLGVLLATATAFFLAALEPRWVFLAGVLPALKNAVAVRSEEHTSELQSLTNLVCRLLLEKKKKTHHTVDTQQS